ncbi:XRE family transcriptional regulator [Mesoaciditoga lauensis]|uniref:XRE family transcriptional regulator n=1 Tax=Mesoaciditoga lauensis TaxID=1495039 RepID=UPI001FE20697|nr:XRE family transcriptional regulator [Mesoaciditoga lauensis]
MLVDKRVIGERIKKLRASKKLKVRELADMLGITQPALSMIEAGRRGISIEIARKLSDIFNVSIDYILGNTDDPTPPKKIEDKVKLSGGSSTFSFEKIQLKPIPVYDGASAGKIGMFPNENEIVEYATIPVDSPGKYGVIVHGNSMEPEISDGDIVIVDAEQDVPNGKKAVVCVDGGILVKVLYRQNGTATLVSLNPKYPPIIIKSSEIPSYILGKVILIIKKVK